jgi:tetratricopeptide (TPR) repeat protein
VTSPDYLGNTLDISALAQVCHARGTPLLVDNAHGAYLRFLPRDRHPITLGADLCCDSAHKTLPVLTGGAYLHFGKAAPGDMLENGERALALFERARPIYESSAATRPELLGGLYNNMALTCVALARFDEAEALYDKAMATMAKTPHGALEQAITCLNMADLVAARDGMEAGEGAIYALADRAVALLDDPSLAHDGYYAFVCEKCAPALEYYGYFDDARRLKEEAERIYAGA